MRNSKTRCKIFTLTEMNVRYCHWSRLKSRLISINSKYGLAHFKQSYCDWRPALHTMKRNITKQLCTCAAVFEVYDNQYSFACSDKGRFQMTGIRQTYRITRLVYPDAKQWWFDIYSHKDLLRSTVNITPCVLYLSRHTKKHPVRLALQMLRRCCNMFSRYCVTITI